MPKTRSPSSSIHLTRRRWTAEEAKHTLLALEQSGLSPGAFAAREGLCPQRLWRWRRKLGDLATPMFAEVLRHDTPGRSDVDDKAPALQQPFEILLPSGCTSSPVAVLKLSPGPALLSPAHARKEVYWDGTGLVLVQKRLETGLFATPWTRTAKGPLCWTMSELALFFEGSELVGRMPLSPPAWRPSGASMASTASAPM